MVCQDRLDLNGFLLQAGDRVDIQIIGVFISGIISCDAWGGWYVYTRYHMEVRLQTGLFIRIRSIKVH